MISYHNHAWILKCSNQVFFIITISSYRAFYLWNFQGDKIRVKSLSTAGTFHKFLNVAMRETWYDLEANTSEIKLLENIFGSRGLSRGVNKRSSSETCQSILLATAKNCLLCKTFFAWIHFAGVRVFQWHSKRRWADQNGTGYLHNCGMFE